MKGYCDIGMNMVLLGNKKDMVENRLVREEQGKDFANSLGIPFMEVSAYDNTDKEINDAFMALVKGIMENAKKNNIEMKEQDRMSSTYRSSIHDFGAMNRAKDLEMSPSVDLKKGEKFKLKKEDKKRGKSKKNCKC